MTGFGTETFKKKVDVTSEKTATASDLINKTAK